MAVSALLSVVLVAVTAVLGAATENVTPGAAAATPATSVMNVWDFCATVVKADMMEACLGEVLQSLGQDHEAMKAVADKKELPFMRFGKRELPFMRFGKRELPFMRFGKRELPFMRFGKRELPFMRFGKRELPFMRFGRELPFMRFGRDLPFMRFGKRSNTATAAHDTTNNNQMMSEISDVPRTSDTQSMP